MKKTQQFEIRPVMPKNKDGSLKKGRHGRKPMSTVLSSGSPEEAIKLAVVRGFIPSNTVMQYYEAVPTRK